MRFIDLKHITVLFLLFCSIILNGQIEDGCVARYTFNNGSAEDDIGNNDGIVNGATLTTDRFGNVDQAYYFDGVDDYIDFGDKPEFRFGSGDFSISVWIKPELLTGRSAIINKMDPMESNNWNQYALFYKNLEGVVNWNVFGSEAPNQDRPLNTDSFVEDSWNNIVLVHTSDKSSLYVNGNLEDENSTSLLGSTFNIDGHSLIVGVRLSQSDFYYQGKIDDICLFDRALGLSEVEALFNLPDSSIDPFVVDGGNVGIGSSNPQSRLEVGQGNIHITERNGGLILTDEIGGCWLLVVNSSGQLITQSVSCTQN